MTTLSDSPVQTVQQFLEAVLATQAPSNTEIRIFRGQSKDLPLLPKLFRQNKAEKVRECEVRLLEHFKNESPYLFPSRPDNDWDWLSLGQHYGLSTRMLDWTANPLTALFFAVERRGAPTPTVYVYHTQKKQIITEEQKRRPDCLPFDQKMTVIIQPVRHSLRIAMQAGWHTVHKIYEGDRFVPLQEMRRHDERITVISISPEKVKSIRRELSLMGIRHATVYGDLQSVCTAIQNDLGIK